MTGEFSLLAGIGATLGLLQVARLAPLKETLRWMDAGLYTLLAALIGARAGYVFMQLSYFRLHPLDALQVWLGGLSWPGALLGGLLAVALIAFLNAFLNALPLALTFDRLAPLAIPLAAAIWLGCWFGGSAYGPLLPEGSRLALLTPVEGGLLQARLPIQLLAALSLLAALIWFELRPPALWGVGQRAALHGLVLAANLLVFSLLRADQAPLWRGLRSDVWAALAFVGLALVAAAIAFLPIHPRTPADQPQPAREWTSS